MTPEARLLLRWAIKLSVKRGDLKCYSGIGAFGNSPLIGQIILVADSIEALTVAWNKLFPDAPPLREDLCKPTVVAASPEPQP